jgi:beta-carotene 3-hydroxylase
MEMGMSLYLGTALLSFLGMEGISYLLHRFVYHKLLWVFHRSHHQKRNGTFELNDIFPAVLSIIAMSALIWGLYEPSNSVLVSAAAGVSVYGIVYFLIHDLYIHERAGSIALHLPLLARIKQGHEVHHRYGGEPYGLLLYFTGTTQAAPPEAKQ